MDLIDRYVAEVGRHLPVRSRDDIEKELKSTLEEMLEDRSRQSGRPRDEAMEMELLKEYGAPGKVAETYHSTQYLIGPRMYPLFIFVLKIVFSVLGVMGIVGLGLALSKVGFAGREFAQTLVQTVSGYIGIAITAFGNNVLIFAILDRVLPDTDVVTPGRHAEWDPATLVKEQAPDTVKPAELVGEIIFTFAALVVLNFYPQILGLSFAVDGKWSFVPMFSDVFFRFLPWINMVWLTQVGLDLYLLRHNAWSTITRAVKILVEAASLAITIAILRTPGIIGFTAESLSGSPFTPETAQTLTNVFHSIFPLILILILIIQGVELARSIYRLWKMSYGTE